MVLNEQSVNAHFELMTNPSVHGLPFRALKDCFQESEVCRAQHHLFADYKKEVPQIQKIFFYIVMEMAFGPCNGKDENGNLGWFLKFESLPEGER